MSQLSDKSAINRIIDIMGCDFAVAQNAYNRKKKMNNLQSIIYWKNNNANYAMKMMQMM
eukprot:UN03949